MRDQNPESSGLRVLIVEDEYFIAEDLARGFRKAGVEIVGPVASLADAIALAELDQLDGAVLDINLSGEMIYPLADTLMEQAVPIVFVTGYDAFAIPERYGAIPRCQKPFDASRVIEALALRHP